MAIAIVLMARTKRIAPTPECNRHRRRILHPRATIGCTNVAMADAYRTGGSAMA